MAGGGGRGRASTTGAEVGNSRRRREPSASRFPEIFTAEEKEEKEEEEEEEKKENKLESTPRWKLIRFQPSFSPDEFVIIATITTMTLERYYIFECPLRSFRGGGKKKKKVERVLRSCPVPGIHTHTYIQTHLKALPRYTSGECNKLQVSQPTQMKFVSRGGKELRSRGWPE